MQYTENYQMYVPEENDQYNIVHWNSNVAKIDKELHDNSVAINNEGVARKTAVSNEATARDNADKKLQANITAEESARKTAVSNEATARDNADKKLQANITAEESARKTAVSDIIANLTTNKSTDANSAYYKLMKLIYPVGALYWSSKPTNPSTLFGGTWKQIKDRFVLAAGDTYKVSHYQFS